MLSTTSPPPSRLQTPRRAHAGDAIARTDLSLRPCGVPVPTAFLSGLDALLRRAGIARPAPRFPVAGPSPDASTPATDDLVVGQVQDFVDDHLAADLTLDRLAEAAGVSPSSLGRRFREEMDTTPWRYVLRRRVEKAKELLRETDRSLAAIALDTGFYDQPHFTRTFKRFEGQTPGDYREATT